MPMYSSIKSILVLLFAFTFLTACGGGGGGTAAPTPTVTAPTITAPAAGGFIAADGTSSGDLGKLAITGTVTGIVLNDRDTGTVSTVFQAANDGTISIIPGASPRLEEGGVNALTSTKSVYNLTAVVSNGTASSSINFTIKFAEAPVVTAFTGSVNENANVNDEVGTISIDDKGFEVSSAVLSGTGNGNFSVSNSGVITVAATNGFDQEDPGAVPTFNLTVVATNPGGDSAAATVTINVTDIADTKPSITAATGGYNILVGKSEGTIVSTLTIDNGGSDIQSATLGGVDASNFALSKDGELKVSAAGATALASASANTVYNLTAEVSNSNQVNADSDTISFTVTVIAAASFSATDTPKLMAIGDSITAGHGEDLSRAVAIADYDAANVALGLAKAADESAAEALAAAVTAGVQVDIDAAQIVKNNTEAALTTAQGVFDQAEFTMLVRTQRFSYRKALNETYNENDTSFDFAYVGGQFGPVSTDGFTHYLTSDLHEAYGGYNVDQLVGDSRVIASLASDKPEIVLIHAGTNDVSFHNGDPVAQTVSEMEQLIAEIRKANEQAIIFVAKIVPIDAENKVFFDFSGTDLTAFGVINNEFVAGYNNAIEAMVNADNHATSELRFVDHYSSFFSAPGVVNKGLYVGDGVHPNDAGDDLIAKNWYCAMVEFYSATDGGSVCVAP